MKVFISYRRADTQLTAGRMAQFLDALPKVDQVFLDVDGIAPGEPFEHKISATLAQASHVFVLMGPAWAGPQGPGAQSRLFEAHDMVRRELVLSLAQPGLKVIPILLDDASMPKPEQLPEALQPLCKLNAFHLRTAYFDEDMDALLDRLLGERTGRGSRWAQAPLSPMGIVGRALGGAFASAALWVALALLNQLRDPERTGLTGLLKEIVGFSDYDTAFQWLCVLMALGLLLGALTPFLLRWAGLRRKARL